MRASGLASLTGSALESDLPTLTGSEPQPATAARTRAANAAATRLSALPTMPAGPPNGRFS